MAVPEHASSDARGRRMRQTRTPHGRSPLTGLPSALGCPSPSVPLPLSRGRRTAITAVITDFRPSTARGTDDGRDGEVRVVATPPSAAMTVETRR